MRRTEPAFRDALVSFTERSIFMEMHKLQQSEMSLHKEKNRTDGAAHG